MFFDTGDIIIVKGTIFKEDGVYDTRIYGHPALVLYADDQYFYYLIISSKQNGLHDRRQYYYLPPEDNKYWHKSYINCKNIYKRDIEFHTVRSSLQDDELLNLLLKFKHYQEQVLEDEFYDEIKGNVKRYMR